MNGYNRTLASHHLESYQASNSRKMKTCGVEKVTTLNVGWECSNFFKLESLTYCLEPRHGGGKKSHVRSSRGLPTTQCIICAQLTPLLYFRSIAPDFGRDSSLRMWGFPVSDRCQHPKYVRNNFKHKTNKCAHFYYREPNTSQSLGFENEASALKTYWRLQRTPHLSCFTILMPILIWLSLFDLFAHIHTGQTWSAEPCCAANIRMDGVGLSSVRL